MGIFNKNDINNLKDDLKNLKQQYNKLSDENISLKANISTLQTQNDLNNLETIAVAQAPLFDFNINNQLLQNGNYNTNLNIMVKQSLAFGIDLKGQNFLLYLLVLQRAQYFKSRVKFNSGDIKLNKLLSAVLYYGALMGRVAITDKLELISITEYNQDYITGELINWEGFDNWEAKEIKANKYALYSFNESNFSLWVISFSYLSKLVKYINKLDSQSRYLITQLIGKWEPENKGSRTDIAKASLFNEDNPIMWIDKDVELAPLDNPSDKLQTIFTFIENYKNWFDNNLLHIITKDITSDKERDVASQQSNFNNLNIINNNYLNGFIDEFLYDFEVMTGINIKYTDLILNNLEEQAEQSLTLPNQNDESDKQHEHND